MARTSIAVVFAGSGGAGAMTAGAVLLRAAAGLFEGEGGLLWTVIVIVIVVVIYTTALQ